jgi:hypothetical protein
MLTVVMLNVVMPQCDNSDFTSASGWWSYFGLFDLDTFGLLFPKNFGHPG